MNTIRATISGLMWLAVAGSLTVGAQTAQPDQCIHVLNPTAASAFQMTGGPTVSAPNCGVLVNSTSSSALRMTGSGSLAAKYIRVTGGTSVTGSATITPAAQTGVAATPNPLTFLVPPATPTQCDFTNFSINTGTIALNPGTYCDGISIRGSSTVTFRPGQYILMGGGVRVSGSPALSGTGVTFFLTAGLGQTYDSLSVTGSPTIILKAPGSGPNYGMLFYQDPRLTGSLADSTITGSGNAKFEGVLYFPTTGMSWTGNATGTPSAYMILIADTVRLTGSVAIGGSYPGGRSPLLPPLTVAITPSAVTVSAGLSRQFTALVTNAVNPAVPWGVSPAGAGTISNSGLYTAPAASGTATVTATSVEDPAKSASATVTVSAPISVTVTPGTAVLYGGQTSAFTATVVNAGATGVVWSVSPSGAGTVSGSGVYTAPATIAAQQTVTVTATSVADPGMAGTAAITLMPPVAVSVTPAAATLFGGQARAFTASVTNAANTAVTWTATPAGTGTVSASGVYSAPAIVGSVLAVTVTATSAADPAKSASAAITLAPVGIGVTPLRRRWRRDRRSRLRRR